MELPGPRGVRRPRLPGLHRVAVGDLFMTTAQVRAELDRIDARWQSLLRSAATLTEGDPVRVEFRAAFTDWRRFYEDAYGDWLAWGSNVSEADRFDREADAWRVRLADAGAAPPVNPTTSRTAPRSELPSSGWMLAALALGVAGVYLWTTRGGPR